ncbi:MAG: hypothetical protein ACREK1_06980 [Longimicrobiales bacterium]
MTHSVIDLNRLGRSMAAGIASRGQPPVIGWNIPEGVVKGLNDGS